MLKLRKGKERNPPQKQKKKTLKNLLYFSVSEINKTVLQTVTTLCSGFAITL